MLKSAPKTYYGRQRHQKWLARIWPLPPFVSNPTSFPKWGIFFEQILTKEVNYLEQTKQLVPAETVESRSKRHFGLRALKAAYGSVMCGLGAMMCMVAFAQPASASQQAPATTTIWTKANEIMQDLYSQVLLISTIAAVVTASIALLMMNFSRSGRTVDESRAWLKRICITWCVLNGLGFIMAYVTPFFADGKWTGT